MIRRPVAVSIAYLAVALLGDLEAWLASKEDGFISKIVWARDSISELQR